MPRSADGRSRYCAQCGEHLLDTSRMTAAEVKAAMLEAEAQGETPCINLEIRRGQLRFLDSPDVPVVALRRRGLRAAAAASVAVSAMACHPRGAAENPHQCSEDATGALQCDFDDDNVDGEVLSPHGDQIQARGRSRHAPLYPSRNTFHEKVGPKPGTGSEAAPEVPTDEMVEEPEPAPEP